MCRLPGALLLLCFIDVKAGGLFPTSGLLRVARQQIESHPDLVSFGGRARVGVFSLSTWVLKMPPWWGTLTYLSSDGAWLLFPMSDLPFNFPKLLPRQLLLTHLLGKKQTQATASQVVSNLALQTFSLRQ